MDPYKIDSISDDFRSVISKIKNSDLRAYVRYEQRWEFWGDQWLLQLLSVLFCRLVFPMLGTMCLSWQDIHNIEAMCIHAQMHMIMKKDLCTYVIVYLSCKYLDQPICMEFR